MIEIAPGLWQHSVYPWNTVNVYLAGDALIDAALPFSARPILRALRGRRVRRHAITHAHPDHMGASRAICRALNVPFWCGEADTPAAEKGDMRRQAPDPDHWWLAAQHFVMPIPGHPVERALREGDTVADFTVIDTPGHTPGHVAYWRERDRVLIAGDVIMNLNMTTMRTGLHRPVKLFTWNRAINEESLRKLAALRPRLVCFGHGPVLRDGSRLADVIRHPEA